MQDDACQKLVAALDGIQQFQQRLPMPEDAEDGFGLVACAINRLLDRLAAQMFVSEQASDSLAAASVRMVLLSDVQERLNTSDKRVKTPEDLNRFIQEILVDLVETIGASRAIYLSRAPGSGNNSILVHGIDDALLGRFKQSAAFREFIRHVSAGRTVVSQPGSDAGAEPDRCAKLAVPLWVNERLAGVMVLFDKAGHADFSRDDQSMLEHLLPDILRVLERIELLFALESSNRHLHEEQAKQKVLTEEIKQTMTFLEMANEGLKQSFITSVHVFANLIEMRGGKLAGHSRRVADTARNLAQRMGMSDAEVQDVFLAGLLHDIGKIGLSDLLLEKPFSALSNEERIEVIKHPARGETALMGIEQLRIAGQFIHAHHERFDGLGYPDNMAGLMIPLGARILAVANDFDAIQIGTQMNKHLTRTEALAYIYEGRGNRYDPAVVDAFLGTVSKPTSEPGEIVPEVQLRSIQLSVGMILTRDLLGTDGNLILSKGFVLTDPVISQLKNFERTERMSFSIWVRVSKKKS